MARSFKNRKYSRRRSGKGRAKLTIGKTVKRTQKSSKAHLTKVEKKDVKKIIASRKETIYSPDWTKYDIFDAYAGLLQPERNVPITLPGIAPVGYSPASALALQTGHYLNSQSTAMNVTMPGVIVPIGGYSLQQGDAATQRDGDYAYLNSSVMKLQITAMPSNNNDEDNYCRMSSALQFRVIHFQSKKINTGVVPSVTGSLFLNQQNEKVGLDMAASSKELMEDFHLNKAQFTIHKDIRFRLTQPQIASTTDTPAPGPNYVNQAFQGQATNPTYPANRNLTLWMPKTKKRIRFLNVDNGVSNYFEPTNYDYNNVVLIICTRVVQERVRDRCLATDRSWSVKANGETRYREA